MRFAASGRNKWIQGLALGIAAALFALFLQQVGAFETLEARSWDWRTRMLAKPGPATDRIVLILLDQNSLDWASRENGLTWPWPREIYGAIIDFCRRNGARVIALDVLFTEPSGFGVGDDEALGAALSEFGPTTAAMFLGSTTGDAVKWRESTKWPGIAVKGLDAWLASTNNPPVFPRAVFPIPEVAQNVALPANVQLSPDPDGVFRSMDVFDVFDGRCVPSLGLAAFLADSENTRFSISPGMFTAGEHTIPISSSGKTVLRFRGPTGTHQAFSAAAVLQSEIRLLDGEPPVIDDPTAFAGKYVFFGFSAPGLYDLRPSPVGGVYTGVEIQATFLDNLLSGDFIRHMPRWMTWAVVFVLSISCGMVSSVFVSASTSVIGGVVFLTFGLLLSIKCFDWGLWMPLVTTQAGAGGAFIAALALNYATEGRQKRFIKNAFKQYLSPDVIEQLILQPDRLKLGGERRELSIFFSDLEGFTSISEGLSPELLTRLLNEYLTEMTDIIIGSGGTVDKYEGDAIIAFWNAPLALSDHADRAVRSALHCQEALERMRTDFRKRYDKILRMRIGLNTGFAVVGNMGSNTRFDYTMLGDAVNLAARLEGANKQFGTYTMISSFTRERLDPARIAVRELGRIAVVGKKEAIRVFEPMPLEAYENRRDVLARFAEGLDLFYEGKFEAAQKVFSRNERVDPASTAYEQKCGELLQDPPENWDGVWVMKSK